MLEWAAISGLVLPHVKKFAEDRAKSLAEKSAGSALHDAYHRLIPNATLAAVNETFFQRFRSELDSSDFKTFTAGQTEEDLAKFLSNPSVQAIIQAPLDAHSTVDHRLLAAIWTEMGLTTLSTEFRWKTVAERHQNALLQQGLATGDLRPVFDKLSEIAEGIRQGRGIISGFDASAYLCRVNQDYGNLKLYQLHTTSADDVVKLRDIFIPQDVRESLPPSDLSEGHRKRLRQRDDSDRESDSDRFLHRGSDGSGDFQSRYLSLPMRPVLEVVSDPRAPRAVIVGGPGSGKSSLLQYLTLGASDGDGAIPLLIELGKYARDGAKPHTVLEFLETGDFALFHLNQHLVDAALKDSRASLLLDGLDEIFDQDRYQSTVAEIKRLAVAYPNARILVTTRIVGYQQQPLADAGFRHFTLQDFDPAQIERFLARWHSLSSLPERDRQSRHVRLASAVRDSPAIRELARNPLLLTMLALVNRSQEIPRERAKAYSVISELLLHHWDFERGLKPDDPGLRPDIIGLEEKLAMVRLLAFEMQQAPEGLAGNLIARERLEAIFSGYLRSIAAVPNPMRFARRIINRLHSRDAILCFAGADSYRFVHRTFLEYFCASEFDRQAVKLDKGFDWLMEQTVKAHWQEDAWHEVIRLTAGLSGETKAARIVEFLLAQNTYRARGSNVILAAQCLTELRQFAAVPQLGEVRRALGELHDFETVRALFGESVHPEDETRDADVRRLSVALQAALAGGREAGRRMYKTLAVTSRSREAREAAVRELARGWKDDPETLPWLKDRLCSDADDAVRSAAVRELAQGWKDDPETLPWLKDRARSDEHPTMRMAAVQELARGWKDDPETLPWLKDRAHSDADNDVRMAAVQELARGWKSDLETLPWLKDRARSDEHPTMRMAAVQELARGWKSDPETLPILKNRARSEENYIVRRAAVQELARGWKDDPETLPMLKDRARSDEHPTVRMVAVQELARGWKDDPETLPSLTDRARSDENDSVRWTAVEELARGWKDDPETLPWLKDSARSDESYIVRMAAVQELARGWSDDPETLPWLKDSARSDEHPTVRMTAVRELARGWKGDPVTLPCLKDRVCSDGNYAVRMTAVHELARGWKDDPETLPILKDRARSDADRDVRRAAVQELARGWSDDPETLPILKDRARSDADNYVRRAAVQELARGWKDDPETLPILKDRARTDEHSTVRMAAVRELAWGWSDDPETLSLIALFNEAASN